jgi:PDZ domain-containing protein
MTKLYERIKLLLRENYKFLLFLILFYLVLTIPLPYYIHTTGGLIDISSKVKIENEYDKKGSINLSYVTEIRGNVLTYMLSYVIPNWDLVNKEEYVMSNETFEDVDYRNKLLLEEANESATMVAYSAAGKEVSIKEQHFYTVYIDELADTTLKIGDELISVNGIKINSMKDYLDIVSSGKENDTINITVIDKEKKIVNRTAKIFRYKDRLVTGIIVVSNYKIDANPKIEFNFRESESGPSGGLMMSLAIYNKLVKEDLTKGLTIVGTGTIDREGNVGEISGIEYKLRGAVDAHADIFLAPLGDNYDDALEIAKKNKYDIKIVGVSTFNDALNYLRNL